MVPWPTGNSGSVMQCQSRVTPSLGQRQPPPPPRRDSARDSPARAEAARARAPRLSLGPGLTVNTTFVQVDTDARAGVSAIGA